MSITKKVFARAGLLGNPSDGYNGKTISISIEQYWAEVSLEPSDRLEIIPAANDLLCYDSPQDLVEDIAVHGYYGGVRLIKATIKRLVEFAQSINHSINRNFAIGYNSTIPRQVGFAGSSAIIIATLKAIAAFHQFEIEQRVLPSLALSVEKNELGIGAGLQDRVIQSYGGMMYMDFSAKASRQIDGLICGSYQPVKPSEKLHLYVAFKEQAGEPTEVFHNNLQKRFDEGEPQVIAAMAEFAELARLGYEAILEGNHAALHDLINQNFDLRRSICQLHPDHIEMVETARRSGAAAKFCGSGGAIIGTFENEDQYDDMSKKLAGIGCKVLRPSF